MVGKNQQVTPRKTTGIMEIRPFQDVSPIENGDFPASHASPLEGTKKSCGRLVDICNFHPSKRLFLYHRFVLWQIHIHHQTVVWIDLNKHPTSFQAGASWKKKRKIQKQQEFFVERFGKVSFESHGLHMNQISHASRISQKTTWIS